VFLVNRPESLERYRFGFKTADFLLCRVCGVYVGAQVEIAQGRFGIINCRTLTPLPDGLAPAVPADYGSESGAERVARRGKRWTPLERLV